VLKSIKVKSESRKARETEEFKWNQNLLLVDTSCGGFEISTGIVVRQVKVTVTPVVPLACLGCATWNGAMMAGLRAGQMGIQGSEFGLAISKPFKIVLFFIF
jgi:hypothetical protein